MVVGSCTLSCIYDKKIMTYSSSCSVYSDMFLFLDDCRTVEFKEREANKALIKHVIRSELVLSEDVCEIKCFLEPNCVSFNYGPLGDGAFKCELNNRTHFQVSPSYQKDRKEFFYRAMIVSKYPDYIHSRW